MLVGGATVRPNVCPQPIVGTTVRLVCTLSSPFPGAGLTVEWCGPCLGCLHTARLMVLLRWDLAKGVLARVNLQFAQGQEGLSSLCCQWSPVGGVLQHWEGSCSTGREAGRQSGMDPQKHSIGSLRRASNFGDGNWFPLGFRLGNGRGRWRWSATLFPAQLSSVFQGSTTLPPVVLLPSRSLNRAVDL